MTPSELSPRNRAVVDLVGRFKQLASGQIKELLFADVSRVSMDRALKRLGKEKYVVKVGRRSSGPKGGTPPAVYMLGPRGWWYLGKEGKYWGFRAVSEHSLKVADLYLRLVELERLGTIQIQPDTALEYRVGHSRADLFVDVVVPSIGKRRKRYVEVQLSARPDVIRQKVAAYWETFEQSTDERWPYVVFVVWDAWHKHEIAKQLPEKAKELIQVRTHDEFIAEILKT